MKPIIGILGGMGPRSTVQFENILVNRLTGTDQDIPTIVTINDGSIPDRSRFILGEGDDPLPSIQHNLNLLEKLGANIICLPCNTATAPVIFNRLNQYKRLVINLQFCVVNKLINENVKKVYLLGTEGLIESKSYQQLLENCSINFVEPKAKAQTLITNVISSVKTGDIVRANLLVNKLTDEISLSGCDAVLLGCTELSEVKNGLIPSKCLGVDTLEVLADACIWQLGSLNKEGKRYVPRPIHN